MAEAHQPLTGGGLLRWAPALTAAALLAPVAAGLAGTLLPAFGWLPALGGHQPGLWPWRAMAEAPGFATAWRLSLATGWAATVLALGLALACVAAVQHRPAAQRLGALVAPLLAMPHAALAIGLAFLLLPSGWLVRAVSPGLSGWALPPDVATVGHPSGWPLVLALLLKEVPYLVLMTLGALHQVPQRAQQVAAARALGYAPAQAAWAIVLPQVWRQIRLPVAAVLAFSLTVVDVALVLGPSHPPTLAVLALRWFSDPDSRWLFPACAAAVLLLGSVLASLLLGWAAGRGLAALGRRALARGVRSGTATAVGRLALGVATALLALAGAALLGLALWSLATRWPWPAAWPSSFTLQHWQRQAAGLAGPALTTLGLGLASTGLAAVAVVASLEQRARRGARPGGPAPWLLCLPLLLPQLAFLFGLQVLLVRLGLDGQWPAVVWAHAVFVLPYLYLSLADPWMAFDTRHSRAALSLGATPSRVFWRIKLPMLGRPLLLALAVGFGVSASLYLPTLLAGAGRLSTLTTEAVTLSAGADRRTIGTWALLQAVLPLAAYALALGLPRWWFRHRRGMR